jgi:hypothetical protein
MKKYFILFYLSIPATAFSQIKMLDQAQFESTRIKHPEGFSYKADELYPTGCNGYIGCLKINIVFYQIELDEVKRSIKIQGRMYIAVAKKDTIGYTDAVIYLATPKKRKLKKKGKPLYPTFEYTPPNVFPNRLGDFSIELSFERKDRLYIGDIRSELLEYDIGKLLK